MQKMVVHRVQYALGNLSAGGIVEKYESWLLVQCGKAGSDRFNWKAGLRPRQSFSSKLSVAPTLLTHQGQVSSVCMRLTGAGEFERMRSSFLCRDSAVAPGRGREANWHERTY
jgi:hypothetical protein